MPITARSAFFERPSASSIRTPSAVCADRREADAAQQLGAFRQVPRRDDLGDLCGTPRIRIRGCASMMVTSAPRLRALAASSSPMKPPPMIATWLPGSRWSRIDSASAKVLR